MMTNRCEYITTFYHCATQPTICVGRTPLASYHSSYPIQHCTDYSST